MKLSNLAVIFIIIIIPIILVFSYYISLQINTINMQTSYTSKQLEATKEAIEAFEINTVEWNSDYTDVGDSKRRNIMASINTFTTNFANSLGIGGVNKEDILAYVPAIAATLYDGYYIYSPSETKEVVKDDNGVAVYITKDLADGKKSATLTGYNYKESDEGKLLYKASRNSKGTYESEEGTIQSFTLNPDDATTTYSHILKPFIPYSARYKKGNTDITVNYTLDNYITIYGTVKGTYVNKAGYLIDSTSEKYTTKNFKYIDDLSEYVWYEGLSKPKLFNYIYSEDNTKVYFDGDTPFTVNSNGKRTNLRDMSEVIYKEIMYSGDTVYQALFNTKLDNGVDIKQSTAYTDKKGTKYKNTGSITSYIKDDASSGNYYVKSKEFTDWVNSNLSDITINDIQGVDDKSLYGNLQDKIFDISSDNDPENENSAFSKHKMEIIKQSIISNLNQAITSYSRNSEQEFKLPVLTESDWNQILRNVCIITFVQGLPIGMKYYNNYTVATSTANNEYINPDEIYLSGNDGYYHMPYCKKLTGNMLVGYRNTDYVIRSYEIKNGSNVTNKYYYRHLDLANQACYYCLVQKDLYEEEKTSEKEKAYNTALARERYVSHKFR